MVGMLALNVIMALFSLYLVKAYFDIYLEHTRTIVTEISTSIFYVATQVTLAMVEKSSPNVLFAINLITVFIFCFISYRGKFATKIILVTLLMFLWMAVEILVGYIFELCGINYRSVETSGSIISKLIIIIIIKLIKSNINYKVNQVLPIKTNLFLLCIPMCSIYIVHNIFKGSEVINFSYTFPVVSSFIILGMNSAIFIVFDKMVEEQELRKNQILFVQQMDLYEKQVHEQEHTAMEIRRLHHDLKAHFVSLKVELENNKIDQALEYINKVLETDSAIKNKVCKSGNLLIDLLVNYKCILAHKKQIKFTVLCTIPSIVYIKNSNLSVILGNVLDNAIEANEKVSIPERFVDISLLYNKGCLTIIVKNSFSGRVRKRRNGTFLSTKMDKKNHGIGLSSVKTVVEIYNGEMISKTEGNVFITTIMLYEEEKKDD